MNGFINIWILYQIIMYSTKAKRVAGYNNDPSVYPFPFQLNETVNKWGPYEQAKLTTNFPPSIFHVYPVSINLNICLTKLR